MLRLSPDPVFITNCPACGTDNTSREVRFGGAVTLAETACMACGTVYCQTLPMGQFNRFPVSITIDNHRVRVGDRGRWLVGLVKRNNVGKSVVDGLAGVPIRAFGRAENTTDSPILLLCLDPCYGHALMMLFNAQRHHEQRPDRPIIAVVPRALVWLVPDYVAETWMVDLPLSALKIPILGFDAFVKNQLLPRFSTVWLSHAHIHFNHRTTRFFDFTRTPKFDLDQFDAPGIRHLTFALREDRLWLRYGWERLLHRVLNQLGLGEKVRPFWARWQAIRYRKLAYRIHQRLPNVGIVATGITGGGQYPTDLGYAVRDERKPAPISSEQECAWCTQYARSQIIVGVHGSGMLLPTSLAAGFVNLLPPDKLAHYAEDSLLAHDNPIHQTLLGRFLSTSVSPRQVAELVVSMLTEFPVWLTEKREWGM